MGTGTEVYLMPARKGKSKLLMIDPLDLNIGARAVPILPSQA
jgi:hypothetical protein